MASFRVPSQGRPRPISGETICITEERKLPDLKHLFSAIQIRCPIHPGKPEAMEQLNGEAAPERKRE
jgi:hypothetical protein